MAKIPGPRRAFFFLLIAVGVLLAAVEGGAGVRADHHVYLQQDNDAGPPGSSLQDLHSPPFNAVNTPWAFLQSGSAGPTYWDAEPVVKSAARMATGDWQAALSFLSFSETTWGL
jgi:hypothetical protein